MSETSLTDSSTGIFPIILRKPRTLFTEPLGVTAPADCLVSTKVLFSDHTFFFFPSFYPFITDNCNYGSLFRVRIKMKIFFFTFNNNLSKN